MDRICWICYTPASETPPNVRWVSPCKCSGDTKWSHEPCLLTWIIKTQSQRIKDGDVGPVIIHDTGSDAQKYIIVEGDRLGDEDRQMMATRLRLMAEFGDKLIRCPQCHFPYEISLSPRPMFVATFMDCYTFFSTFGDFMVPYIVATGATYLVILVSVTFGVYTIVTVCGPSDEITVHLASKAWSFKEWLGVFSVPYWLTLVTSSRILKLTSLLAAASLGYRQFLWPLFVKNGFVAPILTQTKLSTLVSKRINMILYLLLGKYVYGYFHNNILTPLIVGIAKSPQQNISSNDFTEYLTVDLIDNTDQQQQQETEFSLFSITRRIASILATPLISSISGTFMKRLTLGICGFQFMRGENGVKFLSFVSQFDTFTWSLIGGCTFAVVKDFSRLIYNRQRRMQRKNMKVMNYRRE